MDNIKTHYMKLWDSPFNAIKYGLKNIEMRLNDEKRSLININDIIVFTNNNTFETIKVKVVNLYKYDSFKELYENHNKISIGYQENEIANYEDMYDYYKEEDIKKYGALGIEIKLINELD